MDEKTFDIFEILCGAAAFLSFLWLWHGMQKDEDNNGNKDRS